MIAIIALILIIIMYLLHISTSTHHTTPSRFVTCDSTTDSSCKLYNHRDINSKCSSLCLIKNKNFIFSGNHIEENNIHSCECKYTTKESFNNLNTIPIPIPKNKYQSLIFG